MNSRATLLIVTLACAIGAVCLATQYSYECKTPSCGFVGCPLEVGPATGGSQVSGYCCRCKKFVAIRWKSKAVPKDVSTNLPYAPPEKLATVWNPDTGREVNLYPCPECRGPFIEIDESAIGHTDRKMFCPRCRKRSLELWDGP